MDVDLRDADVTGLGAPSAAMEGTGRKLEHVDVTVWSHP